jgi:hypothetical protein
VSFSQANALLISASLTIGSANVAESATFAGVLKHRGAIMRLLRSFTPMSQWTVQTVLAYFISNLNECMSFTQHHQQTRVRLLANLAARLNNKDAPLMAVSGVKEPQVRLC